MNDIIIVPKHIISKDYFELIFALKLGRQNCSRLLGNMQNETAMSSSRGKHQEVQEIMRDGDLLE